MTQAEDCCDPRVARSKAAVIGATRELLTEGGYAGLSIDAISKRSGVARTTIYRQWTSVGEIAHEALASAMSSPPPPTTGDCRTDLRAHLAALADKLTNSDWGAMLPVLVDAAGRDAGVLELQRRSTAEHRAVVTAIARQGVSDGQIRYDVDVDLVIEMVAGAVFTRRLVTHLPIDDAFLDDLVSLAFSLLAA